MKRFKCRYHKKTIFFNTVEEQLCHEQRCPEKEKRKDLKQCKYNPAHVVKVENIERHEKDCPTRKNLEKENEKNKIKYPDKIEEKPNNFIQIDEKQNLNDDDKKKEKDCIDVENKFIKKINYNECFGEEDYIFKKAYVE